VPHLGRVPHRGAHRTGELARAEHDLGPRVDDQRAQLATGQHGRGRHRDRAEVHGGQDRDEQLHVVAHAHQHPLLRADAEFAQATGDLADLERELGVGQRPVRGDDSGGSAVAGAQVAVEKVVGGVERLRLVPADRAQDGGRQLGSIRHRVGHVVSSWHQPGRVDDRFISSAIRWRECGHTNEKTEFSSCFPGSRTAHTTGPPDECAALGIGGSHPSPVESDLVVHVY
jgi:hypothetical protein